MNNIKDIIALLYQHKELCFETDEHYVYTLTSNTGFQYLGVWNYVKGRIASFFGDSFVSIEDTGTQYGQSFKVTVKK